jgi:hypothetical protein
MSSLISWVIFFLSQPRIFPLLAMPNLAFFCHFNLKFNCVRQKILNIKLIFTNKNFIFWAKHGIQNKRRETSAAYCSDAPVNFHHKPLLTLSLAARAGKKLPVT